jgi:hypothetical protein
MGGEREGGSGANEKRKLLYLHRRGVVAWANHSTASRILRDSSLLLMTLSRPPPPPLHSAAAVVARFGVAQRRRRLKSVGEE